MKDRAGDRAAVLRPEADRHLAVEFRAAIRARHYSPRTEQAYVGWIRRFILFHHIRTIQELLGHRDVSTTMVYTHVLDHGGRGVTSPLDR